MSQQNGFQEATSLETKIKVEKMFSILFLFCAYDF